MPIIPFQERKQKTEPKAKAPPTAKRKRAKKAPQGAPKQPDLSMIFGGGGMQAPGGAGSSGPPTAGM